MSAKKLFKNNLLADMNFRDKVTTYKSFISP